MVLDVCSVVAVPELPDMLPVTFPITLPGPISIQYQRREPSKLIVANAEGECREIDSSVFDEASQ